MRTSQGQRLEADGRPASLEQVWELDLSARSHFTAMQVRGRGTLGLDFHLTRLDAATREMFGTGLDGERVRDYIRHALAGDIADASVRVHVYRPDGAADVSVMVTVRPPAAAPGRPQRLQLVTYRRPLAHLKHAGGFGQGYFAGLAAAGGFDEALFAGPDGLISEGTITNIAFAAGGELVWPDAPALRGVMMQVLQRELTRAGRPWRYAAVPVTGLPSFSGALVTNSHGMAAVSAIGDLQLPAGGPVLAAAARALAAAPYDPI